MKLFNQPLFQCKANSLMPVKRCGPLKFVKRKKENDSSKNDENCYSSPTKKIKSLNSIKVSLLQYFVNTLKLLITFPINFKYFYHILTR